MKPMKSNPDEDVVDRISDFPDPILDKILSLLPTKNAVAASILSKRWKNLTPFTILPIKLDLDDLLLLHPQEENEPNNSPSVSFMDFVDKLFNETLSDVRCVESMNLRCQKSYDDPKIVSWVCAALRLNVRELTLSFSINDSCALFDGLNGCTTLVRLKLMLVSELSLPDNLSLPNLKFLHLSELYLEDWRFISSLLECCPALEDLWLTDCNLERLDLFLIKSPGLKNLTMGNCLAESLCDFNLKTPNLEVLIFNDNVPWYYSVAKFKSLLVAHINVAPSQKQVDEGEDKNDDDGWRLDNCVAQLVTACSNTTSLYLAACSINALCRSSLQLPEFENLTCLSLGCIGLDGWALLARLLQNAPVLEKLTIDEGFVETEEGFANFQKSLPVSPLCMELHMKIIEFGAYKGNEDEINLVEYFWKNGGVLQKIVLCGRLPDDSILKRLQMFSRQSKTCQLQCRWTESLIN